MNNKKDSKLPEKDLINILKTCEFFLLRPETVLSFSGGIATVTKFERHYYNGGIMIAPFFPKIKGMLEKTVSTGINFMILGHNCEVRMLLDENPVPIVFLYVEGYFSSGTDTYYSSNKAKAKNIDEAENEKKLKVDVLIFGLAVEKLFDLIINKFRIPFKGWIDAADWYCVPAIYRLKVLFEKNHIDSRISITLHNIYDKWLGDYAKLMEPYIETPFNSEKTALQIGLDSSIIKMIVSRGFAQRLTQELSYKNMIGHLIPYLNNIIGLDNGKFRELNPTEIAIIAAFEKDFQEGEKRLFEYRNLARESITEKIRQIGFKISLAGKIIFAFLGRLCPQKLHCTGAAAVREFLEIGNNKENVVFIFAVRPSHNDEYRQAILQKLAEDFPENIIYTYNDCPFFNYLSTASNFNVFESLYEPFGGVFEGAFVPLCRGVDGIISQVYDVESKGEALIRTVNFHSTDEKWNGLLFHEELSESLKKDEKRLSELYDDLNGAGMTIDDNNEVFNAIVVSLVETIERAVDLCLNKPKKYAELSYNVLKKQLTGGDWSANLELLKHIHNNVIPPTQTFQ